MNQKKTFRTNLAGEEYSFKKNQLTIRIIIAVVAILVVGSSLWGGYLYNTFANIEKSLSLNTFDQYEYLVSIQSLAQQLNQDLETIGINPSDYSLNRLRITVSKTIATLEMIDSGKSIIIPEEIKPVLSEFSSILSDTDTMSDSGDIDRTTISVLLVNRIEYVLYELRNYILNINRRSLHLLDSQSLELINLRSKFSITFFILIILIISMIILLMNQLRMFQTLIKANREIDNANRAKSDFLANMSHEIRTPMNAIIGLNNLLLRTGLNEKQNDYVIKMEKASNNLLGIINDILDFSKIEAGKLDIEKISFNLEEVLDSVNDVVGLKALSKGLEFIIWKSPEVPLMLVGDPLRIEQILVNLANNAIKFTESGEIQIHVSIKDRSDKEVLLLFEVQDTGIGLSEEQQEKLFYAFSQADTSTTRKYGGTGLGLSISKQLSELMGGSIGLKSRLGEGSTFYFTAGLELSDQRAPDISEFLSKFKDMTVMVVDDNDNNREMLADYLSGFSFQVISLSSGREAVEVLARGEADCDVVLMDWNMPEINGVEAAEKIKSLKLLRQPKIILCSARSKDEVIEKDKESVVDGFLQKPISQSGLYDVIAEVIGAARLSRDFEVSRESTLPVDINEIRGAKLLLVEDNEINQQVASELLEAEGFLVEVADNGEIGVNKAIEKKYDLVLMDLQMPVLDGYEATIKIRENLGQELPIVAMTADAMEGVQRSVIEVGMNDYITKPIAPDDLFNTLRKWIDPDKVEASTEVPVPEVIEEERDILEGFHRINGLNIQDGLKRIRGNKKLYYNLLESFLADYAEVVPKIKKELEGEDRQAAEKTVHEVKGVAGNIGATEVFFSATELDDELKIDSSSRKDLGSLLDNLHEALQELFLDLKRAFSESGTERLTSNYNVIDRSSLTEELYKLESFLQQYDTRSSNVLDVIKGSLIRDGFQEEYERLKKHISNFEFGEAEEVLGIIKERLKDASSGPVR